MEDQGANKKTINNYKEDYYYYTGEASKISRALALAGIATIWIFKVSTSEFPKVPNELVVPLKYLIVGLGLDLFQYFIGGLIWFVYYKFKEYQLGKNIINSSDDIQAPSILPFIIHLFYFTKLMAIFYAYILLFIFLSETVLG